VTDVSNLLEPLTVGGLTVRNRILMTAHGTAMAKDNLPSDQHAAYYGERARGGVGLIVMAFPQIHPSSQNVLNEVKAYDDRIVPGLRAIADEVHGYGGLIFMQLGHVGRQSSSLFSEQALWAPSAIPCPLNREMPKAMEIEDIDTIVQAHADAARRAQDGGMDGVEIHSGYGGYLLSSFLSPFSNRRTDDYGGSLENRLRLPLRVLHAVRAAVGPDFVVGMNLQGDDFSPGGLEIADAQECARRIVERGGVDYFVVKGSTYYSASQNVPDMQHPKGIWVPLASAIKSVVDIPVFAVGRVTTAEMASSIIAKGQADMVAMTRQHIADPDTVNKIAQGRIEDIRGCIGCNQGCIDRLFKGHHITCVHNPAAGYERQLGHGTIRAAERPGRVVVIGGGPAGLKSAEVAALRGHEVTLIEAREQLGGQLRIASSIAGREDVFEVVRHLEKQLSNLGVKLRLSEHVNADDVLAVHADAVVVATGSRAVRRLIGNASHGIHSVPGLDQDWVLDVFDVVEHGRAVGRRVLVVDDGEGSWKGISLALQLAATGHEVQMCTPLPYIGAALGPFTQNKLVGRVFDAGIIKHPFSLVTAVGDHGIVELRKEGQPATLEGIDTVILAGWHEPNDDVYFGLKGRQDSLVRVGDAVASRSMLEAIHEAERTVRAM
jgi:mycofactocin system FadH/OYE family oxidoreductase 2